MKRIKLGLEEGKRPRVMAKRSSAILRRSMVIRYAQV